MHLRLLIAEKHVYDRMLLRESLTARGHTISIAEKMKDVIQMAEAPGWDLIIIDHELGHTAAINAVSVIRDHLPHVPIIVLVANQQPGEYDALHKAGCSGIYSKPVRLWVVIQNMILPHRMRN